MSTVDESVHPEGPASQEGSAGKRGFTDSEAFAWLQKFGKSLMLPIAALPAAALLAAVARLLR